MNWKTFVPIIGIALFVYIISKIGLVSIFDNLKSMSLFFLILALIIIPPAILFQAWKWKSLLHIQGINLSYGYLLKIQLVSMFYGFITPGRAGSFIKILYLKEKTKKSLGECSTSVILERLIDLVIVFVLAVLGVLTLTSYLSNLIIPILLAFAILVIILVLLLNKKTNKLILNFTFRFLVPKKLKDKMRTSAEGFFNSLPPLKKLLIPILIGIAIWILNYTQAYFLALALNISIPYFSLIVLLAIATVISLIPITISGLGTREASLIGMLAIFGVAADKTLTLSLSNYILAYILPSLIGLFFALKATKFSLKSEE